MNIKSSPLRRPSRALATLSVIASLVFLGACASKGVAPVEELANARASIAQAESAGALQLAPVEMLAARDKMNTAEAAAREERFVESRRMAEQAMADAEVAERKSRAEKASRTVAELKRGNEVLRQETQRRP